MAIRFSHLFASSTSGSREPGRLSDVKPPERVHSGLPRHAWILKARSRLQGGGEGRGWRDVDNRRPTDFAKKKYKALIERKERNQR